jgi:hypothetical protein
MPHPTGDLMAEAALATRVATIRVPLALTGTGGTSNLRGFSQNSKSVAAIGLLSGIGT